MTLARTLAIVGIAVLGLAPPSRADDGEDAAAWLRKGKAAESIDHDPAKAIEHYRRALELPGATAAGLAAGMRLVELLGASGDTQGALGAARELAARFVPVMDDRTKQLVLEALARLLPPGSMEHTALGLVWTSGGVKATFEAEPSPLLRRFEDPFRELVAADPRSPEYARARAELLEALRALGTDAFPVLEAMIRSEHLRKASEALQLLAAGFPSQGVPLLERLALDADALVRRPALGALLKLPPSPAKWEALDRLRKASTLAPQASVLRSRMEAEMTEEALLAQHALGGPEAPSWLRFALGRGGEPALRRALTLGAADRGQVRDALVTLAATGRYASASVDARRDLEAFLRADPESGTSAEIRRGLATLAAAHAFDVPESDVAGRLAARRAVWARIVDLTTPAERVEALRALALAQVPAPAELFADARFVAAFMTGWQGLAALGEGDLGALVEAGALEKAGPFWTELAGRLLSDANAAPRLLELAVEAVAGKVPADLADGRWVAIAARDLAAGSATPEGLGVARFLATAAAQSQEPAFLALYRQAALTGARAPHDALTEALPGFRGPQLIDLLTELLGGELPWPDLRNEVHRRWTSLLQARVKATMAPAALVELVRKARDQRPGAAPLLLGILGRMATRAELLPLLREEAARPEPPSGEYAEELVALAANSRSEASIPLLVRIYKETGSAQAAAVLNELRSYRQRVKAFEDWTRQPEDVGTEVEASLSSADAAVRIAGVQAIVVLERRAAIARLLKLIRSEKEASVLDEANLMLRKLSKAVLDGAPPTPGAPDVHYYKELEFGPDGKPLPPPGEAPPAPAAPTPPQDVPLPGK